jgi:hypothetical protein
VLHTGLGPDAAGSGFMTQVIGVAVQEGGMPIPRGGGARLVDALVRLIEDHGGACETGRDVERVLVRDGGAAGVRLADGEEVAVEKAVIANVTPTQLYGRLVEGHEELGRRFRYGRSEMQIHFALSEPPRWEGDERLAQTAIVHVTPGLDGVSRAVNEAERGLLPAEATVVVGQPLTMDPSRAPDGAGLLWIQLQELPWHVKGDAAGELDTGDGTWTEGCASATPTGSRRGSLATCRTWSRPCGSGSSSRRPTCRRRTSTCTRATRTRARSRSTRTCSGDRFPRAPVTRRRSRASGTSERARTPARALAPAPERWSPSSCSAGGGGGEALDLGDHDRDAVVRRRPRRLRAAGADGIGIWEMKLEDDSLERFRASGLGAAAVVPAVPSILPLPLMEGPEDPAERVEAICGCVRRVAPFEPECVLFLTGPGYDREAVSKASERSATRARRRAYRSRSSRSSGSSPTSGRSSARSTRRPHSLTRAAPTSA